MTISGDAGEAQYQLASWVEKYMETFNQLNAKSVFIETIEGEEIYGVHRDELCEVFDDTRDF